jgi:hypothetical protein
MCRMGKPGAPFSSDREQFAGHLILSVAVRQLHTMFRLIRFPIATETLTEFKA